jgi:serine/threonine protein kinase
LALTPGTRLGVYEVTAPIGEGGSGKVYGACDTKLNRDVALKILADAFATERRSRPGLSSKAYMSRSATIGSTRVARRAGM